MSKRICVINEYAGSPSHGMEYRHYYLGKNWVESGHDVSIISSSYSHLYNYLPVKRKEYIEGIRYRWIKTFNYGDSHNKKRVFKWMLFTAKLFFLPLFQKKPDIILVSPMAPFPILPAWIWAKLWGAKLIFEVKDIWPLSVIELGNISPRHPLMLCMSFFERFAVKRSDLVVSNLPNYGSHLRNDLGIDRDFHWISNGISINHAETDPLDKKTLECLPEDKFIIGYAGTVGAANALDSFLEGARILNSEKDILWVVVGDGQEKRRLMAKYESDSNILFLDSVRKNQVPELLSCFNACYIGLKKERLFTYGVSPNKLFDYMLSGRPILYAIDSGDFNVVQESQCGISVEAENPTAIAEGALQLFCDRSNNTEMGEKGMNLVLREFTYQKLAEKYVDLFNFASSSG